jgi:hypothetical protein
MVMYMGSCILSFDIMCIDFFFLFVIVVCDGKHDGDALLILGFLADASNQIYFEFRHYVESVV